MIFGRFIAFYKINFIQVYNIRAEVSENRIIILGDFNESVGRSQEENYTQWKSMGKKKN